MQEYEKRLIGWEDNDFFWTLKDIRLLDVYQKMKAHDFAQFFKDNCKNEYIEPELSYHNGKYTITYSCQYPLEKEKKKEKDYKYKMGIQIEDNQYRYCFGLGKKKLEIFNKNRKSISEIEEVKILIGDGWFEKCNEKDNCKKFKDKSTHMAQEFDSYSDGFIYQYFNITNDENDYSTIANWLLHDLKEAKRLLEKLL